MRPPFWLFVYFILSTGYAEENADIINDSRDGGYTGWGENDDVQIENMREANFNTSRGEVHEVTVDEFNSPMLDSKGCEVQTPSGMVYTMEAFNMNGVVLERDLNNEIACRIRINVSSAEEVGQWVLRVNLIRFTYYKLQRRYPINIHVEEIVHTKADEVHVKTGNDLYMRLKDPTDAFDTCKLIGPDGRPFELYELDERYPDTCGYIIRNVSYINEGKWEITYGNRIMYRAFFQVIVTNETSTHETSDMILTLDRSVDVQIGPKNIVYCTLQDPKGFTIFAGHGRCNLTLDRVTMEHQGIWKMSIGHLGRVTTEDFHFNLKVKEADQNIANTSVVVDEPNVTLSCSVSSSRPILSCHFREPSGRVLIAAVGVGESRYVFHGTGVRYESGVYSHECGIRIAEPQASDLGLWRCAVETDGDNYYGFLSVHCPWAVRDPEIAAEIITEPTLTADRRSVSAILGDAVRMACSVQSAVRYCYFRAPNGTIFNVGPGHSDGYATYVGAGLNAGECGIRFPSLSVNDTGKWSCNVGFSGDNHQEQRATINVTIEDSMVVRQHEVSGQVLVEGQVYGKRPIEYCRFVRIDGLAFRGEQSSVPRGYVTFENLPTGKCGLAVKNPSILDRHPWTVVARIMGQDVELSRVTAHNINTEGDKPDNGESAELVDFRVPYAWMVIMFIGLILILIAAMIGPKKNREWTGARANAIRDSFRNSFNRKLHVTPAQNNTAVAA